VSTRPIKRGWLVGLPLLVVLAVGCDWPGKPNPADRPVLPDQVLSFSALFQENCSGCHGAGGKLGPAPPLNDDLFRASVPEKELKQVITFGRGGTPMPAFGRENGGSLTETQIQVLVHEIKGAPYRMADRKATIRGNVTEKDAGGVSPAWGVPAPLAKEVPPYLLARGPAGDKELGIKVFARACASCHGSNGEGGRKGDHPVGAINDQAFLSLMSDQVLRRYAITGRPDLGMPDYTGKAGRGPDFHPLTSQEISDLVALLGYWRQGGSVNGK
jgi:cytochrome c oxidase cbb3-type subunit 3